MNNQINIQKAAVSKEFNRISVFMFVFKTFFKPLEELAHTIAFAMSFPAARIYIAYKTKQAPTLKHIPFSILHLTFSISILSHKSTTHAGLSRQKS